MAVTIELGQKIRTLDLGTVYECKNVVLRKKVINENKEEIFNVKIAIILPGKIETHPKFLEGYKITLCRDASALLSNQAPPSPNPTPDLEMGKMIGKGSFGKVFMCKYKGHKCVVKKIKVSGRSERESAFKEASILLKELKGHPNIVKCYTTLQMEDSLGLVMEYCDGRDLRCAINFQKEKEDRFHEHKIVHLFTGVLKGLEFVHSLNILHRDVKPENILLQSNPNNHYDAKLGDFGISRVLQSSHQLAVTCVGTLPYMSPEVVKNQPYSSKADMWAMGCVLVELMSLNVAFPTIMHVMGGTFDKSYEKNYKPQLTQLARDMLSVFPHRRLSAKDALVRLSVISPTP